MRGFIDRVVDGVAVILLDGGGRAYVPIARLPEGSSAGRLLDVTLMLTAAPEGVEQAEEVADVIERLRSGEHTHADRPQDGRPRGANRHG